jgi:hypothetical protein
MNDLKNKPEGATHYIMTTYYKFDNGFWWLFRGGFWMMSHNSLEDMNKCVIKINNWSIYNNTLPLSELSDEQRGLLFNHWCVSGYIEVKQLDTSGWVAFQDPSWDIESTYRAKQKTERELFIEAADYFIDCGDDPAIIAGKMFDAGFKAPKVAAR